VLDLIASLRGRVTVFLSSHILSDVERVCDTVAIIRNGQLALVADKEELMQRYAVPVVELELDQEEQAPVEALIEALATQKWVDGITQDKNKLRVAVSDEEQAKQSLLPLLVRQGVILDRYEWVRPTLEEIFLKVSA
jgi:ABC-2 type transport system ATP-binding protein